MRFHPPGPARGYTALMAPPMATLPAATAVRGSARRGVASAVGSPLK
jgi:hypothetical protein